MPTTSECKRTSITFGSKSKRRLLLWQWTSKRTTFATLFAAATIAAMSAMQRPAISTQEAHRDVPDHPIVSNGSIVANKTSFAKSSGHPIGTSVASNGSVAEQTATSGETTTRIATPHSPHLVDASAPSANDACNDAAPYYNVNTGGWGFFSASASVASLDAAMEQSNVVWILANWIGLPREGKEGPRPYDYMRRVVRERAASMGNRTVKIIVTDSADNGGGFPFDYNPLHRWLRAASKDLGRDNVHLASRTLVRYRDLSCFGAAKTSAIGGCDHRTPLSELNGTLLDYRSSDVTEYIRNGVVAKWDFSAREEYLPLIDEIVRARAGLAEGAPVSASDFENSARTKDVAHFWEVEGKGHGRFRDRVTTTLRGWMKVHNLTGTAGLVSPRGRTGRTSTSRAYAEALLDHKIVIVAQRDSWEDHLRLFESLSSGVLVLSDPMTHPPAGVVDGETVVVYQSLEDMARKILYYLRDDEGREERVRIARAGRKLVLEHHRPDRRYKRLMLGDSWPKEWTDPVAPLLECGR